MSVPLTEIGFSVEVPYVCKMVSGLRYRQTFLRTSDVVLSSPSSWVLKQSKMSAKLDDSKEAWDQKKGMSECLNILLVLAFLFQIPYPPFLPGSDTGQDWQYGLQDPGPILIGSQWQLGHEPLQGLHGIGFHLVGDRRWLSRKSSNRESRLFTCQYYYFPDRRTEEFKPSFTQPSFFSQVWLSRKGDPFQCFLNSKKNSQFMGF